MKTHKEYFYPEPIIGFDVLKWKQENQTQIRCETEGMTDSEVREYFRKRSEAFQAEQRLRQAAEAPAGCCSCR